MLQSIHALAARSRELCIFRQCVRCYNRRQRHGKHSDDLITINTEGCARIEDANDRRDNEAIYGLVEIGQSLDHFNPFRMDVEFFPELAQGGPHRISGVARLGDSPGEADLSGMATHMSRPLDENDPVWRSCQNRYQHGAAPPLSHCATKSFRARPNGNVGVAPTAPRS